ncbi:hypothetical protein C8N30_1577 [Sulfitobacter guttiformis]|uniref:Uncharacterized protein n=1 Tax=Sulfitobacter guttiformis TaxID=74349 RepID=A0A420DRW9_9RHOB|nr:hypothetical protein C8N30_1577 [Sulfitobacter guttiformis]
MLWAGLAKNHSRLEVPPKLIYVLLQFDTFRLGAAGLVADFGRAGSRFN